MLMLTLQMRSIERIDIPSTSIERICARFVVESLFMGEIVSNLAMKVKQINQINFTRRAGFGRAGRVAYSWRGWWGPDRAYAAS